MCHSFNPRRPEKVSKSQARKFGVIATQRYQTLDSVHQTALSEKLRLEVPV
jgi:hypothetical protein